VKLILKFLLHAGTFIALTLLTQIGGLAYAVALGIMHGLRRRIIGTGRRAATLVALTAAIYAALTMVVVPPLAERLGRTRLPCNAAPFLGCALNRTYARPAVADLLTAVTAEMARVFPGSGITILDASFPFFDGFPLIPHLSHKDGRRVDLAFFYRDAATGRPVPSGAPSPIGYFHFERPPAGYWLPCHFVSLRWDLAWAQPTEPAWQLDEERTRAMILWLKQRPKVTKILLEPYLAERLGVDGGKVKFQGCFAARHDDHFHVEVQ
jgi:hypothetical protein